MLFLQQAEDPSLISSKASEADEDDTALDDTALDDAALDSPSCCGCCLHGAAGVFARLRLRDGVRSDGGAGSCVRSMHSSSLQRSITAALIGSRFCRQPSGGVIYRFESTLQFKSHIWISS